MGMRYSLKGGNVAKGQTVDPSAPAGGGLAQPPYSRGAHAAQNSQRLKSYQQCVARQLAGSRPGSRSAVQSAFKSAANSCRGGGGYY